jgi:hypothetical protein
MKDVDQGQAVKKIADYLKKSGKVKLPTWVDVVKLGIHKQLPPTDPDWYFVRTASIARRLYIRSPVGKSPLLSTFSMSLIYYFKGPVASARSSVGISIEVSVPITSSSPPGISFARCCSRWRESSGWRR